MFHVSNLLNTYRVDFYPVHKINNNIIVGAKVIIFNCTSTELYIIDLKRKIY